MPTEQEYINYKDFVESLDEATPSANDKAVFNDANGPKGSLYSAIANFVLNLWASFVNAFTTKTSFANGDKIVVVNGNTATTMDKDVLLDIVSDYSNKKYAISSSLNNLKKGAQVQRSGCEPSTIFLSGLGNNIYKFSEALVDSNTTIESIEVQSTESSSGYVFIVDTNEKILDKFYVPSVSAGWNTIRIGKKYDRDVYIAVRGMKVGFLYTNDPVDNLFSLGLYEASGNSYGNRTIGEILPFTQNVPSRYYQFAVKLNVVEFGVSNIVGELLGVSKTSDFESPKVRKTGEIGYSLFGKWYKMTDTLAECANCGGASIAFKVKGASHVDVDIEQLVYHDDPAYLMAEEPYIAYSVDGSDFTRVQISTNSDSSVKRISISGVQEHFVWIVIDGMCQSSGGANRSTGWSGVYIKSITTDGTMYKVKPAGKQILYVGDSMVEGIDTLGTNSLSSSNSNIAEWSFKSAVKLHAFPLMQGYGGTTTWNGELFEKYSRPDYSQDTYINDNKPDVIVCEYGHNDYTLVNGGQKTENEFIAQYRSLVSCLTAHYPGVPIVVITPFAQRLVSAILTVSNTKTFYYLIDTSGYSYETLDGTHPSAESGSDMAEEFAKDMIRLFGKEFFV